MKKLLLLLTFVLTMLQTQATHLMGGQITSKNIGGLTYEVTLTLYRDVQGITMNPSQQITYTDSTGNLVIGSNFVNVDTALTYPAWNLGNYTPFNIGNGVERYTFTDTVVFPYSGKFKAFTSDCCRNASIINIPNASNYAMYLDVNIFADSTNSSPVFLNEPITLAQDSVLFTYNPSPYDADGDSLSWVLDTPMDYAGGISTIIPGYVLPYSYPSTPFQLDQATGEITFLPNTIGNFQISVKAIEWRNGVQIGYIRRDMQLIVVPSANMPVQVSTNISVLRTTSANPPIYVNIGETLTLTLTAYNPDALPNAGSGNLTCTQIGSAFMATPPIGASTLTNNFGFTLTITWTPTQAQVNNNPYYMTFRIGDYKAPFTFYSDYTFRVFVTNNSTGINEITSKHEKYFVKSIDMLGREIDPNSYGFRIDVYNDGTTRKIYKKD